MHIIFKGDGWTKKSSSYQTSGKSGSFDPKLAPTFKDLEKEGIIKRMKEQNNPNKNANN